jgi:hypothetical protein
MKNELLIDELLQQGREAEERVRFHFSGMNAAQLNWQPAPTGWSIAQCLDHLIASHNIYFSDLEKITAGNYTMKPWERFSPLSGWWGRVMKDQLKEKVKRKMKTPEKNTAGE